MSLTETYQSRKKLLADNLNSMGVTIASPNDGLTTLINSVLNIEPSISGLDLDTALTLTSSSASITVDESIILTSKLTASYDDETLVDVDLTGVLTGATVLFKEGNTTLGSGVTGSDGICTATISNLTVGTHTIKAIFEGTDNFNDCESLSINIVVTKPEPASISIVAEKPIMSKGENNKITATVLDSDGNPCVGETVSFSVVDGEDLGTAVTDASGEAFVYYLGKGVGDLYIKAECMLVSKTYEICDAIKYIDEVTKTHSSSSVGWYNLADLGANIGDCEISATLKSTNSAGIRLDLATSNQYENKNRIVLGTYTTSDKFISRYDATGTENYYRTEESYTANTDLSVKIVRQNGNLVCSIDNNNHTFSDLSNLRYIGLTLWSSSKTVTVTDLKVKPL